MENEQKVGRPSKFQQEFCELAYKFCLLGATDEQLAEYFNVAVSTLNLWKLEHPEFSESLKKGKEVADAEIAEKLYHRAKGYSHESEEIFCNKDGEVTRANTIKHYAPDPTSMIFWLKNRQPQRWKDKREIDHSGEIKGSPAIELKATYEQLKNLFSEAEKENDESTTDNEETS